ncbi:hypothetical protein MD484_g2105, partial [Candolleomyces efflorescens]
MSPTLSEDGLPSPDMLTFAQRLEIIFAAEAAVLSGISIVVLISYKLVSMLPDQTIFPNAQSAASSGMLSFELANGKQTDLNNLKTSNQFITAPSTFCYTQGMVQLIGTNLIDWSTFAITAHTYVVLVLQRDLPRNIVKYLAGGVLAVVSLIVGITVGVRGIGIVGPTGLWCWITASHKLERLFGEYFWMWSILALTMVFYTIAFLVLRGYIVLEGGFRLHWVSTDRVRLNLAKADDASESESRKMATQLLLSVSGHSSICITVD